MSHIHIYSDGETIATLWLDHRGHVQDDGSIAAHNAVHGIAHGLRPEHGQRLLDDVVKRLDYSTRINAAHCHRHNCPELSKHLRK